MANFKYDDHMKAADGGLCTRLSGKVFREYMLRIDALEELIDSTTAQLKVLRDQGIDSDEQYHAIALLEQMEDRLENQVSKFYLLVGI
jgi:hypothetical protein